MELSQTFATLRYLSILAPLLVLARMASQRLLRTRPYTAFGAMLAVGFVRDLILLLPSHYSSHSYALAWGLTLPVLLLAQAAAAISTYAAIASLYAKIGSFAVRLFQSAFVVSAVCCCAGLPFETRRMVGGELWVRSFFLLDRWINTLLIGGLVLAIFYLARFPRPLKRLPSNLVLHTTLLCSYFGLYSIVPFVLNLVPIGAALWVQVALLAAVLALYATWAVRLSAGGENREPWPELDERTLRQIEARNRAILEVGAAFANSALRHAAGRR